MLDLPDFPEIRSLLKAVVIDKEGNEIDSDELVSIITEYVHKECKDKKSELLNQLLPLSAIFNSKITNDLGTGIMAVNISFLCGYTTAKYCDEYNIDISSEEEEISEEKMKKMVVNTKLVLLMELARNHGMNTMEVVLEAYVKGLITPEELDEAGLTSIREDLEALLEKDQDKSKVC